MNVNANTNTNISTNTNINTLNSTFDSSSSNYRTLPCNFFLRGNCNKGNNSTYIHELSNDSNILKHQFYSLAEQNRRLKSHIKKLKNYIELIRTENRNITKKEEEQEKITSVDKKNNNMMIFNWGSILTNDGNDDIKIEIPLPSDQDNVVRMWNLFSPADKAETGDSHDYNSIDVSVNKWCVYKARKSDYFLLLLFWARYDLDKNCWRIELYSSRLFDNGNVDKSDEQSKLFENCDQWKCYQKEFLSTENINFPSVFSHYHAAGGTHNYTDYTDQLTSTSKSTSKSLPEKYLVYVQKLAMQKAKYKAYLAHIQSKNPAENKVELKSLVMPRTLPDLRERHCSLPNIVSPDPSFEEEWNESITDEEMAAEEVLFNLMSSPAS